MQIILKTTIAQNVNFSRYIINTTQIGVEKLFQYSSQIVDF